MGGGPSLHPAMTNFCWRLVDLLSRMLKRDERDAVLGDQAESGVSGGQALRDLLGLIARRQVALWQEWQFMACAGWTGYPSWRASHCGFSQNRRWERHIPLAIRE